MYCSDCCDLVSNLMCYPIPCSLCAGVWYRVGMFEDLKEKIYLEMHNGECIFAEVR